MRRRPWVLVVALLIFAIAYSAMVGIRYLNRSDRLRREILKAVGDIPGELTIGGARLDATTLRLSRVRYSNPDMGLDVRVDHVSVRFTVSDFLLKDGGYERLIHSISIVEPTVELRPVPPAADEPDTSGPAEPPDLSAFSGLERVIVRDGTFRYMSKGDEPWFELHSLDGWFLGGEGTRVSFDLSSSFYDMEQKALNAKGNLDLKGLRTEADIRLQNLDLKKVELPASAPVNDLRGMLNVRADLRLVDLAWSATAHWSLDDGHLQVVGGPEISGMELQGNLEDRLLTLDGGANVEGDRASLTASLDLKGPEPNLTASADIPHGRIGKHLGTFADMAPEHQPPGIVHATADFDLDLSTGEWSARARARSDSIGSPVGNFFDVGMDLSWDRDRVALSFDSIRARWQGMDVKGFGVFDPDADTPFDISAEISGAPQMAVMPSWAEPISKKRLQAEVSIRLTPDEGWVITADGRARHPEEATLAEFSARYTVDGYGVTVDLYPPRGDNAHLSLSQRGGKPIRIQADEPQVLAAWYAPSLGIEPNGLGLDATLDIQYKGERLWGSMTIAQEQGDLELEVHTSVDNLGSGTILAEAGYTLFQHDGFVGNGELSLRYAEGIVDLERLSFMDYAYAYGRVNVSEKSFEEFTVVVEDLDIGQLAERMTSMDPRRVGGMVNGKLEIAGSFSRPDVEAHFDLFEGRYGNLSQYWGLLTLETDLKGDLQIRRGELGRGGTTIVTLGGHYSIPEDRFSISVDSPGYDARILTQALTGRDDLLAGTISLSGRLEGALAEPRWQFRLGMVEARAMGIRFDRIQMVLRGVTTERLGHVLYIDQVDFVRRGHYRLQAFGAAPLSRGAGEVAIVLDGNIPEFMPQMSPFVRSASGSGRVEWNVMVVGGRIVSSTGSVNVSGGHFTFEDIFPDMRNIDVDIAINEDGRMNIRNFRVEVGDGNRLIMDNAGAQQDILRPIRLESLGLNLGVLRLRTVNGQGIPVHIPGVMTTPDYARVQIRGRENSDWMTISGPVDSLLFEGAVRIAHATVTFPPEEDEEKARQMRARPATATGAPQRDGGSILTRLAMNARWNLNVHMMQDNRYQRTVSGLKNAPLLQRISDYIGRIDLDVAIEPTEPERPIRVTGRLKDDTFRLNGEIISTQGSIEFLDLDFQVQRIEVLFDRLSLLPVVSARAVTTMSDPSQPQFAQTVYLTLYVIDPVTGERQTRGRWGDFTLVLEDESGSSQEEVLGTLGYDIESLEERAQQIGAEGLDRMLTQGWLRPIEREAARWLGLDLVRVDPTFAENILFDRTAGDTAGAAGYGTFSNSPVSYFRQSRVTFGKYVAPNLFLSYTGQLGGDPRSESYQQAQSGRIGLIQRWELEYRLTAVSPNFVLQGGWEYDNLAQLSEEGQKHSRSIRLTYTFTYDLTKIDLGRTWMRLWH